jgi:ABC-type antimicrobial peptide transport system permease subunit
MARLLSRSRGRRLALLASITTLAAWRWRQQWFLLLVAGVGTVVAVMMVCALPLFSSIMFTSALRGTVGATPESSTISASIQLSGLSTSLVDQATSQMIPPLQQRLGAYLAGAPDLELKTADFEIQSAPYNMSLHGVSSMQEARSHLELLQGRLPSDQGSSSEIALSPEVLGLLKVRVNSTITLQSIGYTGVLGGFSAPLNYLLKIPLHIVGSFEPKGGDPYWHGEGFGLENLVGSPGPATLSGLVSTQALLRYFDGVAQAHSSNGVYLSSSSLLTWFSKLDPAKLSLNGLNVLIDQLAGLQRAMAALNDPWGLTTSPFGGVTVAGQLFSTSANPSILEKFRAQLAVAQIPAALLALQITCLILFFVSVIADLLVDRQAEAIAVLRSRGASARQVLGSLTTQSLGICLLALLAGPPLALLLVSFAASRLLLSPAQGAMDVVTRNPMQALLSVSWYAVAAVIAALLTMILSLYRASRLDIVSVRREAARPTRRPLWQRLRLDLWGMLIALSGYLFSLYLASSAQLLNSQADVLLVSPLALLAPVFLLLATLLFLLRFFPMLLRLVASLALRARGASSMLALAHIARTPRQPLRMALLLGLATAFAIFSLVFSASQAQRAQDVAGYQVGSDFSGDLPLEVRPLPLTQETALYAQIPGVTSATVGYVSTGGATLSLGTYSAAPFPVQVRAVDSRTFAGTAFWTTQDSDQALPNLLALLNAWKARGMRQGQVPALVDATAWNVLHLHVGSVFSIVENNADKSAASYVVVGEVSHIPTVDNVSSGGVLVDFSTMQAVQAKKLISVPINHVWLRTTDDPGVLTHVRSVLSSTRLRLDNLADRRALAEALSSDPLALDLLGLLSTGATAALLLALVANVLVPVLSVRARRTSFAVLRALGTPPHQVVRVLAWEQGIVFALALLLGGAFGALLSLTVVPNLIFTGIPAGNTAFIGGNEIFAIQQLLPPQVIFPVSLLITVLALVGLCMLALIFIGQVALRPLMGQALRISED